jgi:2-phospho-L-lactate guanylyltransferase
MQPSYWSVVIPIKLLLVAKSRLDFFADADRSTLALAMAVDTVSAALASDAVGEVIVVTNDERASAAAREVGAIVVEDEPDAGLNAALQHGAGAARARHPDGGVAALAADVPALRADELSLVLHAAEAAPRAVVADADGKGTVLLTARADVELAPAYGEGSLLSHQEAGALVLDVDVLGADVPGLRRDVDTIAHLREVLRLGCGPRTAALAEKLLAGRAQG